MKTAEGFLSRIKKKGKFLLYFLLHYKKYTEERSFYPEKEHKSKSQIFRDFLFHILKYGEIDYCIINTDMITMIVFQIIQPYSL